MIRVTAGKPMPPIGFQKPPQEADHRVSIFMGLVVMAGICSVILSAQIGAAMTRLTNNSVAQPAPHRMISMKDQTRCCDANGNDFSAR